MNYINYELAMLTVLLSRFDKIHYCPQENIKDNRHGFIITIGTMASLSEILCVT